MLRKQQVKKLHGPNQMKLVVKEKQITSRLKS